MRFLGVCELLNDGSFKKLVYFLVCVEELLGVLVESMDFGFFVDVSSFDLTFKEIDHPFRQRMNIFCFEPDGLGNLFFSSFTIFST